MDILETIDLSTCTLDDKPNNLYLDWLAAQSALWQSEEQPTLERTNSASSAAVHTVDDSNSTTSNSSDDDEPPTPTSSIDLFSLSCHSLETAISSPASEREECLEKENILCSNEVVSRNDTKSTLHSVQTQIPLPSSPISTSWLRGLLKKKPKVGSLFKKSQGPTSLTTKVPIPDKSKSSPKRLPVAKQQQQQYDNYTRYPLPTERAIYRSSHVKLANPRRPLHQQVAISNMMYWYLSILKQHHPHLLSNRAKAAPSASASTAAAAAATQSSFSPPPPGKQRPHSIHDVDASFVAEKLKKNKYKPVVNINYTKKKSFN